MSTQPELPVIKEFNFSIQKWTQPGEFNKWRLTYNNKIYKLYPTTFFFVATIAIFTKWLINTERRVDTENAEYKQRKKRVKETDLAIRNAIKAAEINTISKITQNKISVETLSSYTDLILYLEEKKSRNLKDRLFEENQKKYEHIIKNL